MSKKVFGIITTLIMIISIVYSITTVTSEALTPSIYYYNILDDGTVEITGCRIAGIISTTIPRVINGKTVTGIGNRAFCARESLSSIIIPDSVTSIGYEAFYSCENLTSITIGNSVTSIGHSAFWCCTSLTSITIPNSVISIGDYAFSDCESLTEINVDSNNKYYSSQNGVLFNYNKTELILYPIGKTQTTYTIPNGVTSIGDRAFEYCEGLTSITIGNSVKSIGDDSFSYCESLTSVTIPNGVTNIGRSAFYSCSSLTSITIPNSVTSIEDSAFKGCNNDLIIKCYKDSYAEQYAKENNIKYELIADNNPPQNTDNTLNTQTTNNNSNKPNSTTVPTATTINNGKATQITNKMTTPKLAKVKSIKLTAKKKKLNVSWKKVSGATGYEIMYAKNNKFKGKKTVTVKKNKVTLKRLKSKKKYFVKVRAYKTVNGNTYFGNWSKVVKKKVK